MMIKCREQQDMVDSLLWTSQENCAQDPTVTSPRRHWDHPFHSVDRYSLRSNWLLECSTTNKP